MFTTTRYYLIKINNILFYLLLFGVTCLLFYNCKTQKDIILTIEKGVDSIVLKEEASFIVRLESSYGNGYQWQLDTSLDSTVTVLDSTSVIHSFDDSNNSLQSRKTTAWKNFHFHAKKQGRTTIKFYQVRIWEENNPIDSIHFHVITEQ